MRHYCISILISSHDLTLNLGFLKKNDKILYALNNYSGNKGRPPWWNLCLPPNSWSTKVQFLWKQKQSHFYSYHMPKIQHSPQSNSRTLRFHSNESPHKASHMTILPISGDCSSWQNRRTTTILRGLYCNFHSHSP